MITKYKVNKVCVFKWKGRGWKGEGGGNKGGKFIEYVYARFCLIEILTSESLKVVDFLYIREETKNLTFFSSYFFFFSEDSVLNLLSFHF